MKTQKGFTLVEVLVAIWIIGTALVALVGLNIGNIKFSKSIDELSQAMFILYDVRMRSYLQTKYNTEIPPIEYPQNYEASTDVLDLSSMKEFAIPFLSGVNIPPIPIAFVKTPSEKRFELFGVSYTKALRNQ